MNISETCVLVTGGGSGIGRMLVERLLADSAKVCVLDIQQDRCDELMDSTAGRVKAWGCDVSNSNEVDRALSAMFAAGYCPDVLINNAGVIHSEPLVNMLSREDRVHSRDSWRRILSANLDSVFYVTSRVVDNMMTRRCKGVVVSISSIAANGNAGQSAYSAAKAGVNALTRTWAKELGGWGLRFVAIAPGFIDTPSTRSALNENTIARIQQQIPLRRLGKLENIYLAVRHAIENDYVTGTVIEVDGGLVI